ncbi:hypothetical protein GGF44_002293 [Coemansia sp. RSA 1694]|nr:hypothetical protein IWW47_000372 [Coemansia sp. RSA 2052]KAJ2579796.1 hypothetical protein GGH95_002918 [Coemansia sp. RSA 1836]KAJ2641059.1 hypothetical protein GGF44_002293 [Coemansia sp. RSA 1694]
MALYTPAKRRRSSSDPFFAQGNAESVLHCIDKQLAVVGDNNVRQLAECSHHIICHDAPCLGSVVLPSALAFERHYDQMHRNTCSVCSAIFPSAHWLDLHVQELHDAFFDARVARGDKAFRCFLPTCAKLFARPGKRRLHMIDKHKFPVKFNWSLLRVGLLPIDNHHHPRRHRRQQNQLRAPGASEDMDVDSLATTFAGSMRVSAPKSISFGRRGGHH